MRIFYALPLSFFRKTLTIICLGTLVTLSANAQVANYAFSQVLGSYTPITGGTILASGAGFWDDNTFGPIPIAFTFTYDGTSYTDVVVAANGYVKLGTAFPYCCWYNGVSIQNELETVHGFSE